MSALDWLTQGLWLLAVLVWAGLAYRVGLRAGIRLTVHRLRDTVRHAVVHVVPTAGPPETSVVRLGEGAHVRLTGGQVYVLVVPPVTRPLPAEVGTMLEEVTR